MNPSGWLPLTWVGIGAAAFAAAVLAGAWYEAHKGDRDD